MIIFHTYKDFEQDIRDGKIKSHIVHVRLCSKPIILDINPDGSTMLTNGSNTYYNSRMGEVLKNLGLSGMIHITTDGPSKIANRWIDRFVNEPENTWGGFWHLYHHGDPENSSYHHSAFPVADSSAPMKLLCKRYSEQYGDLWDGFLITAEMQDGATKVYRILPSREIVGTVRAFLLDKGKKRAVGCIAAVQYRGREYVIRTNHVPAWLFAAGLGYQRFEGAECKINYTQFSQGERVANFASARLVNIAREE